VIAFELTDEILEKYGLKDPYSKVTADYADQTITLMSSKPDENGMAYVMNSTLDVIFQVNVSELGWVTTTYEDLVNKLVIAPMVSELSKITVMTPSKTYAFDVKTVPKEDDETSTTTTFSYNGKELTAANFRKFYRNMMNAKHQEFTEKQPSGDVILTFKYEYTDGRTPNVVEFFKGENRMVYISLNGDCESLENESYVEKILEDVEKVVNNEEVKEF